MLSDVMPRLRLYQSDHSLAPYRAYREAGYGRPEAREGGREPRGEGGNPPGASEEREGGSAAPGLWYGEYLLACNES